MLMSGNTGWGDLDPKTVRQAIREEAVEVLREILRDKEAMTTFWSSAFDVASERTAKAGGAILWSATTGMLRKGLLVGRRCNIVGHDALVAHRCRRGRGGAR